MIFRFMQTHQTVFSVSVMCAVFSVSRSGYYAWLRRPICKHKQAEAALLEKIRIIHRNSDETYGSPRVHRDLKQQGDNHGEKRIARLMREDGLKAKTKRRFKATTDSKHNLPVAPNLLNRQFRPTKPNEVYAGDITYVWTTEGWLYLAVVIDLFSRSVVGWAMNKHMTRQLAVSDKCPDNGAPEAQAAFGAYLPFGPGLSICQ